MSNGQQARAGGRLCQWLEASGLAILNREHIEMPSRLALMLACLAVDRIIRTH